MLPLIVALFWLAVLTPWALTKIRNRRSEKSIDHFLAEHQVLSRQGYSVAPARRLDDAYLYEEQSYEPEHEAERSRPRLTVVQDDDTYSSLESRTSWDEWDRDYDYDEPRPVGVSNSPYAPSHRYAAYGSAPAITAPSGYGDFVPVPLNTYRPAGAPMRVRRHRILAALGLSAVLTTGLDFLIGLAILQYLAILSWVGVVLYVAAALLAVSQGYLEVSSLLGRPSILDRAPAWPEDSEPSYDDVEYGDETLNPSADVDQWRRERRHYALG